MSRKSFVVSLLVISCAIAILYFLLWRTSVTPRNDAKRYLHEAYPLLDKGYAPSIWAAPGYPTFLATLFTIAGRDNYTAVLVAHLFLRLITFLLASLLVLQLTRSRTYTVFTLLLLWSPSFMSQTRHLYTEPLAACLITATVYLYHSSLRTQRKGQTNALRLLSGVLGAAVAVVRPVYQAMMAIWWIIELLTRQKHTRTLTDRLSLFALWVAPSLALIGGWSVRNYHVNGFFGVESLLGFHLCSKTVGVLERLPEKFAVERQILIRARDARLLTPHEGHKAYLSWGDAIEPLRHATGMEIPQLSKRMLAANLALVRLAPLNYLHEVATAFALFWMPCVSPDEAFGRLGQTAFAALQLIVQMSYLVVLGILATLTLFYGTLAKAESRLTQQGGSVLTFDKHVAVIVLYTAILSSAVVCGQTRLRVPVDPLIVASVVCTLHFVIQARRATK